MAMTFAFDVYGTLVDTHGVMILLEKLIGDQATEFSRLWREKQLEYSFRRGLKRASPVGAQAWLVSSNPFDVIGAISSGMRAAWVQRSKESIFDPWEFKPTIVVKNLLDLAESIKNEINKA
ncbi:MAG: hypothetical protein HN580_25125 [Deltaproteobacteria bacterium]|jgi:2-haloacid dehalogenase|nr:hypothetical protein [Deltaproteobacteria bacterium]MBT4640321.1 hypothetical protein [Deltaproteobacteria bacterium]MBT6503721.1 hypothetical protein [Deltaproteobacteria bacterium]MBT7152827.1 hypothetical protein [Deltaproteobacteria bacterium]MBT7892323.1 hypothetical protein [Deltaproteobacteria bacterium]